MSLVEEVRTGRRTAIPGYAAALRRAAGVPQRRMADELGVHRVTLARWELGLRRPRGRHLAAWLGLLDALRDELES